jgi:hypothetical protein
MSLGEMLTAAAFLLCAVNMLCGVVFDGELTVNAY